MAKIPYVSGLVEAGRWQELDAKAITRANKALGYLVDNTSNSDCQSLYNGRVLS